MKKRTRTLLVPYVIWCALFTLLGNINSLASNVVQHYPLMRHIELDPLKVFGLDLRVNPPLPLWYLRALMIYVIVSPVLFAVTRSRCSYLGFVLSLASIIAALSFWRTCWIPGTINFDFAPVNIAAFGTGMYLCRYPIHISRKSAPWMLLSGVMLFVVMSVFRTFDMNFPAMVRPFVSVAAIALFLSGVWGVCPSVHLPQFLKGQSFPIYILHALFVPYVLLVAQKFPVLQGWIGFFINIAFLFTASLLLSLFIRRFFPSLGKILFGGR